MDALTTTSRPDAVSGQKGRRRRELRWPDGTQGHRPLATRSCRVGGPPAG
jgi:hypothetical protein